MKIFSRKSNTGWGRDVVRVTFAGDERARLLRAIDITAEEFGSPVAQRLADEVVLNRFKGSRSAVNSLRREGIAALPSIPVVAAWIRNSVGRIPDDWAGYGIREGMLTLGDFRKHVWDRTYDASGEGGEALKTFDDFLEGTVQEIAFELLNGPNGRGCRGAISYLRSARQNPERCIEALGVYLDNHPGETGDGDLDCARGDAIYAMQELSQRARSNAIVATAAAREATLLEPEAPPGELFAGREEPAERELEQELADDESLTEPDSVGPPEPVETVEPVQPNVPTPRSRSRAPDLSKLSPDARAERSVQFIGSNLVPRLRRELTSSNPNARMAALNGLAQLGDAGLAALPDIWDIANDPRMLDGTWKNLREQALTIATHMAIRAQRGAPTSGPTADDRMVELLVQRALTDSEPQVRAQAIRSLVGLPTTLDLGEVLEEGLQDENSDVRMATVLLLQDQANRPLH